MQSDRSSFFSGNYMYSDVVFVHLLSRVWLWDPSDCSPPGFPCSSPSPRLYSDSCPSSQWCHPTISSSFVPFSSCLQSFSASGSFPMSQFFASGGHSIGVSASASVLPMNIQDCSPRDSQEAFPTPKFKSISSLALSFLYSPTLTSIYGYWKNRIFD